MRPRTTHCQARNVTSCAVIPVCPARSLIHLRTTTAPFTPLPRASPAHLATDDVRSGEYVGTLRWDEHTAFMTLPPMTPALLAKGPAPLGADGWNGFIDWRLRSSEGAQVVVEPTLLDGLSFPVTLAWMLRVLRLTPALQHAGVGTVIIAGASRGCEERLLRRTQYWNELSYLVPGVRLRLCFVGPEVSPAFHGVTHPAGSESADPASTTPAVTALGFRGGVRDFLTSPHMQQAPGTDLGVVTLIGFNTGMGSHVNPELMHSWIEDLVAVRPVLSLCTSPGGGGMPPWGC